MDSAPILILVVMDYQHTVYQINLARLDMFVYFHDF